MRDHLISTIDVVYTEMEESSLDEEGEWMTSLGAMASRLALSSISLPPLYSSVFPFAQCLYLR